MLYDEILILTFIFENCITIL